MGITTTELTPIEQTAFLTAYARALDSRWPRPILGDTLADEVVGKIDYDFNGLGVQTSVVCQAALGAKMLDDRVRDFVERHPDAVIVDLGAGIDSGFYRVAPPPSVDWYSVDLPGIIGVARRGAACQPAFAFSTGVAGGRALAGRHPGGPPHDACRRRIVRVPPPSRRSSRSSGGSRRPLRLRRTRVQRLRTHRLVQPPRDQAVPAKDVQRRRKPVGLPRDSRTRTIPKPGTRG